MKKQITYIIGISVLAAAASTGCKKTFFNRPPEDQSTVGTYYQTAAQVQSSTNILYAAPWFGLNGKALLAIGDLQSGNAVCYAGTDGSFDAFRNFSQGNATLAVQSAWNSLYTVVAQCNALLNNLPTAAPASVPSAVVNNALGEAHVLRAAAYFYLVRNFGNVPIITDPAPFVGSFQSVNTNPVADVYQFIINDLKFGEANCTPGVANTGHVSSASATGLLAKVYLYRQDYANARASAEKVINSGEFGLIGLDFAGSYTQQFELAGNNSKESMIALQWTSNGGYGFGNQIQSVIADGENGNFLTGTGDGYGELGPSWDLQDAFKTAGDSIRRHGCIMLGGEYYAELHKAGGGYTVPLAVNCQGVHAAMKKYVVGTPADNNGNSAKQATSNNTYLLRYADIYLIEAEAIMGTASAVKPGTGIPMNTTSSDPTALKYLNLVRKRAGLPALTSFTYQQLINERRLELAIEGEFWYDLQRLDGFNNAHHPVAIAVIAAQNRGDSNGAGTAANNYTDYARNTLYVTATDANFLLPVPATEAAADPALLLPPVPYKF
ncbi:MAG TPA: RagB/SusD family nutrient uptake outer membrane protein [Chitinophagaceae bacterium]|nr:RagB/SusD family nutrient uptake outer membrane protein [Chitinophagaceae bacterium]